MRSTAFALLGVTAAMALGLVAFAVQQDWPLLPAAPIPGVSESAEIGEARIVAEPPAPTSSQTTAAEPQEEPAARSVAGTQAAREPQSSQVSGSRQLASAPPQPAAPQPTTDSPSTEGTTPASPTPAAPSPSAPTPAPTSNPEPGVSAPVTTTPSTPGPVAAGGSMDEGDDEDVEGDDEDEERADDDQERDDDDATDRGKSYGKHKSYGGWKGSKPPKDSDADAEAVTPSPAPPSTTVPADETADQGKVDEESYGDETSSDRGRGRGHGFGRFGR